MMGVDDKKVLLLGAGLVSGPFVDFYSKQSKVQVTVATESREDAHRLVKRGNITPFVIDVKRESDMLDQLISAKDAGVTIMNESGLDPGIDHMLAMECIDEVAKHGGKVTSFISFCGGLPAPESSDNPLRYKFSWSPKGVLTALLNPAKYLQDGKEVEIASGKVLDHLYPIDFLPGFNLIGYANRDSVKYGGIYGIIPGCRTLVRGTLRYKGFVEAVKALNAVGLLNTQPQEVFNPVSGPDLTWKQLMASLLNQKLDIFPDSLCNVATERVGGTNPIGVKALCGNKERHRISLVAYGEPKGFSAMSRTVGYTCAIVSNMVLQGEIQRPGILRPVSKEIYRPALKRLTDYGIVATKEVTPIP
ncbi:unnamed protein product [Angiostrongylus costaricensis]|uniref:Sacchrp_dh_NADP domain-containing protein n=1 Tax=Angiostrongylus costaricensis TaxID=334426 RepID=A0A158PD88_ANGCS|nr:unnamed protein product [Angiostrongylus costaricensis]